MNFIIYCFFLIMFSLNKFARSTVIHTKNAITRQNLHIEAKVKALGHEIPTPSSPKGNYVNFTKDGKILYLSGHLPILPDGSMIKGRLGENVSIEEGQRAGRAAALQLLATIKAAAGDLDNVEKVLKLTGFVNSTPDFTQQPQVMNGCSDFIGEVFGTDVGRHARSAVGVNTLPLGVAIEVEAIIKLKE